MLTTLRTALNAATRLALVRIPTLMAIRAMCDAAYRLLRGSGVVAAAYVRGSYARGDFRPFISDIDLAIAVRRPPPGRGYETCRALQRRLRVVRVVNPFVRDAWQTIITEAQWPLVARYGYLFGVEEWRRIGGQDPWTGAAPGQVDERLLLAAHWNRQHLWTTLAQRQALRGETSLRALGASLKKARSFADKISTRLGPGVDHEPATLPHALRQLARSAERLVHALDLDLSPDALRPAAAVPVEPAPRERRALDALAAAVDLDRDVAIISTEGQLLLVTGGEWSLGRYAAALDALAGVYRTTGVPALIHSAASLALAPLRRRLRVLRATGGDATSGMLLAPLLLREQMLYQALFAGTHIWVAPARPDPRASLAAHLADALEHCTFFLTGELRRDERPWRDALAEVASLDPPVADRLRRVPALRELLSPGREPDASELFELGSLVAGRLAELLLAAGSPAAAAPAAARARRDASCLAVS